MSEQPAGIIHVSGPPLTEQQAADLKERFAAVLASPAAARAFRRQTLRLLSRRTRLRLWCTSLVNITGIRLCDHGQWRAAEKLWRIKPRGRAR